MPDTHNAPDIDRIPLAHSIVYAVRGAPEVADEYNATRTIKPTEISLTYRTTEDSQLGRVHAYVKGWWMQDGARVPMDKPVGRHFWGRDFEGWPEWLAEEARLHDPAAAPAPPPADRAALLAEAADGLLRLRDSLITEPDVTGKYLAGIERSAKELRRMAAEAQPETPSMRLARESIESMVATVTGGQPAVGEQPETQEADLTERLERGRQQLLEAMSAVSEDRTCTGWAADWARTLHAEGGIWETLGRAVGWPTGNYDRWVWVSWDEAAALYAQDPQ